VPSSKRPRVIVQLERPGTKANWSCAEPSGDPRGKPPRRARRNVQQHDPRPAEQPLEPPGDRKSTACGLHVHGYLSHGLVGVDRVRRRTCERHPPRALMSWMGPAREVTRAKWRRGRCVISPHGRCLDRHRDLVRALDHHQLHATVPLREPLVGDPWKIERRDHDPGPAPVASASGHRRTGPPKRWAQERFPQGSHPRSARSGSAARRVPPTRRRTRRTRRAPATDRGIPQFGGAVRSPSAPERAGVEVHRVPEDRELAAITGERVSPGGMRRRPDRWRVA